MCSQITSNHTSFRAFHDGKSHVSVIERKQTYKADVKNIWLKKTEKPQIMNNCLKQQGKIYFLLLYLLLRLQWLTFEERKNERVFLFSTILTREAGFTCEANLLTIKLIVITNSK